MESMDLSSDYAFEVPGQVYGKKGGIRAASYIIDVLIVNGVSYGVNYLINTIIIWMLVISNVRLRSITPLPVGLGYLVGFIGMLAYFTTFEALFAATPGKIILGMRVMMDDCRWCSFKAALVRGLYRFIDGFFLGIPAFVSMKSPLYQRFGDKAAKTIVVGASSKYNTRSRPWWWALVAFSIFLMIYLVLQFCVILYEIH